MFLPNNRCDETELGVGVVISLGATGRNIAYIFFLENKGSFWLFINAHLW